MDLFKASASERLDRVRQIKDRIANMFGLNEESTVLVTELACREEGCPPVETVIAIFRGEVTQKLQFKLHKPVLDIAEGDLAEIYRNYQELQHREGGQNGNNR